jgi:hypothetical protein
VLAQVDTVDLMPVGSWSYDDLGALVAGDLDLAVPPARRRVHPTGGETPLRALPTASTRGRSTTSVSRVRPSSCRYPWSEDYAGPGTVLTSTVTFDRDGKPQRGSVIGTGVRGERFAARVDPDGDTLGELTSGSEAVGRVGTVSTGDTPEFSM